MNRTLFVQSLGRCGSYMLYSTLEKIFGEAVWGGHEYPDEMEEPQRVIFLFANPIDIVLSVKYQEEAQGIGWVRNHFANLKADFGDYPNLLSRDVLHLGRLFDAWYQPQAFPLLTLRYETMWRHQDLISAFVGRPVVLPKYRPRRDLFDLMPDTGVPAGTFLTACESLHEKVGNAADAKIWEVLA